MPHPDADAVQRFERGLERLRNHDGSVPAARAADRNRQVGLALPHVLGNEKAQEARRLLEKFSGQWLLPQERDYGAVAARFRLQRRHEMRVRQKTHIEHVISIHWQPELEAKTEKGDHQRLRRVASTGERLELLAQL